MDLGKIFVKSVVSQIGRETGRSISNKVLKNTNHYSVKSVDYDGRVNKNDSELVLKIKEINKLKPLSTDKGNLNRLFELVNIGFDVIDIKEKPSHQYIQDLSIFLKRFNNKLNTISEMISDDFDNNQQNKLDTLLRDFEKQFNDKINNLINNIDNQLSNSKNQKNKSILILLTLLPPFVGLQNFYINKTTMGIINLLMVFISPIIGGLFIKTSFLLFMLVFLSPYIINIFLLVKYIKMSDDDINLNYSKKYQNLLSYKNFIIKTFSN